MQYYLGRITSRWCDIIPSNSFVVTKQYIIQSSHKLPISTVDWSGNSLRFVDISSNLQAQLDSLTSSSVPSISYASGTTTTLIVDIDTTAVDTLKFYGDDSEQTTTFTTAIHTSITTNTTMVKIFQLNIIL